MNLKDLYFHFYSGNNVSLDKEKLDPVPNKKAHDAHAIDNTNNEKANNENYSYNEPEKGKGESIAMDNMNSISDLEGLKSAMKSVDIPIKNTARNFVFCDGQKDAPIMLIGEAPGKEEDIQGKPFVGASGKLLEKILGSFGVSRDKNLYITNVLPWRPPENRTPEKEEIMLFLPYLKKHIELHKPKLLILCGSVSMKALLDDSMGITRTRGKWHELSFNGIKNLPVLVVFHPAFLMRQHSMKFFIWKDMLALQRKLILEGII